MREHDVARDKQRGVAGVIDTLSAGYAIVNRHPWVIAVPVLLDIFFWLGHHLSLAPLVQKMLVRMPVPVDVPAEMLQAYQDYRDGLARAGESFNLFSLLVSHFPGIPSLMSTKEGLGPTIALADPWAALGLSLLLPMAGIWLASAYYVGIGNQVRGVTDEAGQLWRRVWRTWGRLLGFLLMALGVLLLFGLPLLVLALVAAAINTAFLSIVASAVWLAALWAQFYLFFVLEAMVISDVGPIQAIRNSVAVVRFNLGSTLGLVVLIWVITLGMPLAWDALAQNTPGTVVGIIGNAYIATGLAAASMIYYRDRFAVLAERTDGGVQRG